MIPATARAATDWRDDAACRDKDPALFFGPDGERELEQLAREASAKAICSACPVRTGCLEYAMDRPARYGLWGGLNEAERLLERRRRTRALRKEAA